MQSLHGAVLADGGLGIDVATPAAIERLMVMGRRTVEQLDAKAVAMVLA